MREPIQSIRTIFLKSIIRSINHQILLTVYCQITLLSHIICISASFQEILHTHMHTLFVLAPSGERIYLTLHFIFSFIRLLSYFSTFFLFGPCLILPGCNQSFSFIYSLNRSFVRTFARSMYFCWRGVCMCMLSLCCHATLQFSNQLKIACNSILFHQSLSNNKYTHIKYLYTSKK